MEQGYDGAAVEKPDFPAKREEEKILERLPSDTEFANYYLLLPTCTSLLPRRYFRRYCTYSKRQVYYIFAGLLYTVMIGFDSPLL